MHQHYFLLLLLVSCQLYTFATAYNYSTLYITEIVKYNKMEFYFIFSSIWTGSPLVNGFLFLTWSFEVGRSRRRIHRLPGHCRCLRLHPHIRGGGLLGDSESLPIGLDFNVLDISIFSGSFPPSFPPRVLPKDRAFVFIFNSRASDEYTRAPEGLE